MGQIGTVGRGGTAGECTGAAPCREALSDSACPSGLPRLESGNLDPAGPAGYNLARW